VTGAEPRIAIVPDWPLAADAVRAGGGRVVALEEAQGLVWVDWSGPGRLGSVLEEFPAIGWVHLPGAGIESFLEAGLVSGDRTWTCSKGAHSSLIAEHAFALALAGLHSLASSARATSWEPTRVTTLAGQPVTIVGGGGIATALVGYLAPFGAEVTVVRRHPEPVPGAHRTLTTDALHEALPHARLVVLALALTPETRHIIAAPELDAMHRRAWLVNVSRGGHVDTDALVDALERDAIAGAALDVTDPEPLAPEDPLWDAPNLIVLPHIGSATHAAREQMAEIAVDNLLAGLAGEPLPHEVGVS
jgi:phosphoglycerate dehydrogenase-like enzyme